MRTSGDSTCGRHLCSFSHFNHMSGVRTLFWNRHSIRTENLRKQWNSKGKVKLPDASLELCTAHQVQSMKEGVIISLWVKGCSGKALRSDLFLGKDDGGVFCLIVGWEGSRGVLWIKLQKLEIILPPGSWVQLVWAGCTHQRRISSWIKPYY